MMYSRFLNAVSLARKPSILRKMTSIPAVASPDLVFLAGALPNPSMFPFESAIVKLKDGRQLNMDKDVMTVALQYGPTPGYGPLVEFLKSLSLKLHNPPNWSNSELVITNGCQDGLAKVCEMLIQDGDYIMVQEPCYTGTLAIMKPLTKKILGIASDKDGLCPESLLKTLSPWSPEECSKAENGVPKVLYVNPIGNNPSGSVMSDERMASVYEIACKYNLMILEDDPYYYVRYEDTSPKKSLLSMDTEGRVMRFDSFSKILSAGIRLGYCTGPKPLIERLVYHMQVSVMQASQLSQVLVWKLIEEWGMDGFLEHTHKVQEFYKSQRDAIAVSADRHLTGLCEWVVPEAGMFLWMKVPSMVDVEKMVLEDGMKNNVLVVPGKYFMVDSAKPNNFIRIAYSVNSPERMDLGLERLAKMIRSQKS